MAQVEPLLVAARLRRLIGPAAANLGVVAGDLNVTEEALRAALDEVAPNPTVEVMVAVVRRYGIDPTWLMIGEYDSARHRAVLGDDESPTPAEIAKLINNVVVPSDPVDENPESLTL